jgi:hypothetical protein
VKLAALVVASTLLCACSTPGTMLRYAPANPDIEGINAWRKRDEAVQVLLIHGICPKDEKWVAQANRELAEALGMQAGPTTKRKIGDLGGELHVGRLVGDGPPVTTFALLWSPVTRPIREKLCYDTTSKTGSCPGKSEHLADARAWLNAKLKNEILDGCLAEAVYAMGKPGIEQLGSTIEKGLEIALNGGNELAPSDELNLQPVGEQTAPLFVIAQSLGSKLFVDAAIRMANRSCEASRNMGRALQRTVQVFMEANQLPILALAYNPPLDPPDCLGVKAARAGTSTGLGALVRLRQSAPLREGAAVPKDVMRFPLKVAAFTDPNDLLSYTLVPAIDPASGIVASDIVVVNDWTWLGLYEDAMNAHTTYGAKCRVKQVIANGTAGLAAPCDRAQ